MSEEDADLTETEILDATGPARAAAVGRAAALLQDGALVALPTETVYGVAARHDLDASVARLRALKGRDAAKPFTVACASVDAARALAARFPAPAARLAAR